MTLHASGVELDGSQRAAIEGQVRAALGGVPRIGHVHVRLYGDVEGTDLYTCYIRVDGVPAGGIAMGETAPGLEGAVARASSRLGAACGRRAAAVTGRGLAAAPALAEA